MASVTTVKLNKRTKVALEELKSERETYDDVINKLVLQAKRKTIAVELAKEYKSLGKEDIELLQEWETASSEIK